MSSGEIFVVVFVTAIVLVVGGCLIGWLLGPKSTNPQKGEQYESGIPTRGTSWLQFNIGYYLFAILFLMFDVETVLLFPWATIAKSLGEVYGIGSLLSIAFFLVVLVLGLAYAWRKGALEWK